VGKTFCTGDFGVFYWYGVLRSVWPCFGILWEQKREQPLGRRVKFRSPPLPTSIYDPLAAVMAYGGLGPELCNCTSATASRSCGSAEYSDITGAAQEAAWAALKDADPVHAA